jgi:ABC-type antimicrobial peptide transport system ATPase subunit
MIKLIMLTTVTMTEMRRSPCDFFMEISPKQQRITVTMPLNMFQAPVQMLEPSWKIGSAIMK